MEQFYPCVYILTNKPRGVLYTGVTSNLPHRLWQHKHRKIKGFSQQVQYRATGLVRSTRRNIRRNNPGEADKKVESGLEDRVD